MKIFVCNLCGGPSPYREKSMHRELPSCITCSSTIRQRQIIEAVTSVLPILQKPLEVVGLSDHSNIEAWFSMQPGLNYTNTYLDHPPILDITEPDFAFKNQFDILISSDVLEHVMYPMSKSLCGHFDVLRPGGVLVLTTPWVTYGPHVEHFPWLVDYFLEKEGETSNVQVIGVDSKGQNTIISNPIFHGGGGKTLEIRVSSLHVLQEELARAGFIDIQVRSELNSKIGIFPWSDMGVIVARRPQDSP